MRREKRRATGGASSGIWLMLPLVVFSVCTSCCLRPGDALSTSPLRRVTRFRSGLRAAETPDVSNNDGESKASAVPFDLRSGLRQLGRQNFEDASLDDIRRARSLVRRDRLARVRELAAEDEKQLLKRQDESFILFAMLPPIIATLFWGPLSYGVSEFINHFGVATRTDLNEFANNLLRPTLVGVVVPVISISLATLFSTSVNVLRQRQVDLRAYVNKESCELRLLRRAVFGMFGTRQHAGRRARALTFMSAYCKQLTTESRPGAVEELETMQLTGGIASNELDRLAAMLHGVDGASASRQGSVATADNLIMSLSNHRSERVALLLSVFPPLHWVTLGVLSALIVVTYLLVSNQDTLQYLDSIQLRFLFGTLVGVLSSTFTLCYDLADPLNGSFSMEGAAEQLKDLNLCLKEDVREALSELDDIDKRTRNYLRSVLVGADVPSPEETLQEAESSEIPPKLTPHRRYGFLPTLYFHALTGPFGDQVRTAGDLIAWIATAIRRRLRSILVSLKKRKWRLKLN